MGSPENEEERHYCHEGPRRFVKIGSIVMVGGFCTLVYSEPEVQRDSPAVGRYQVTFAEYDHFCDGTMGRWMKCQPG